MENLTKEIFWNDLQAKYPDGMKTFCNWIDEYKKKNDWDMLFRNWHRSELEQIKFHHIPYAMQMGIWFEFVIDRGGCSFEVEDLFTFDLRKEITEYIKMLQSEKQ